MWITISLLCCDFRYYIRRKSGSKRWLIFLDGGHYCFDKRSCRTRAENEPNMTSSNQWPLTKEGKYRYPPHILKVNCRIPGLNELRLRHKTDAWWIKIVTWLRYFQFSISWFLPKWLFQYHLPVVIPYLIHSLPIYNYIKS